MNILIIGSGVIGLSTAFELSLRGHKVRVLTRNYEEGASWVAGGMLAPFSEGLEGNLLDFSLESLRLYPDFVERLEEVSKIKLFYNRNGILRLSLTEEEHKEIKENAERYRNMGIELEEIPTEELEKREPNISREIFGGVLFREEGNVDAEKLMDALIFACESLGIKILIDDITEIERSGESVECIKGYRDTYRADFYVFATGAWSKSLLKVPVYPVKGQILKVKGLELEKVYYSSISYIIPKENHVLIGATSEDAGFDSRTTLSGINRLIEGAVRVIPALSEAELLSVKVGFRPGTPDEMPIFDFGENFAILTGHYRNGILWAPASASLALDLIENGSISRYFELFSPKRFVKK
ncbi:glycine oxidase [Hydrogenivirga caldilitoris]|uniref:Glycine oxidase n=1 Tax=Hydrogenivirga caldilitoris TaxID=246264 RepID=A0A497XQE0_9AQUI|nr:glycine oxidase ThiO [Hydrogenivirga caldilitoris]RLJ71197.1 glycine oxidase [Hydrogenivirga caldilitoris]